MNNRKMTERFTKSDISKIYNLPFMDLLYKAQKIHRKNHNPNEIQCSSLLSIKTGSCSEDCKYCSQSAHYDTKLEKKPLINADEVIKEAHLAKKNGSTRFCMGAAWRKVPEHDVPKIIAMIKEVKNLGMESCVTLGMVSKNQAMEFKEAGLDYYNHNLDTSRDYYKKIITTRTYEERLETIKHIQDAGINVCSGGILGLGEKKEDRISFLWELVNMDKIPDSVPINNLIEITGTPLANENIEKIDSFEFVRVIATARIIMPKSYIRLSAGREKMNEELQALCFFAGANSIFSGEKLLTTENKTLNSDEILFRKLGMVKQKFIEENDCEKEVRNT